MDNQVITAETLKPTPTVEVPTAPIPTPSTPALAQQNLTQGLIKEFDLTQKEQQAVTGQENLVTKMLSNIEGLSGESAYRSELTQQSNIGTLRKELGDLNSQILQKQAEIQQDDVKLVGQMRAEERRDTLLPFAQNAQAKLAGDAQIMRALKTSEIGVLNALALGKQGNIELAKSTIDEAVNAKYAPFREQNAIYEAQLKAIEPLLTAAEKKTAQANQLKVNAALKEIDKVSDFQKTALNNAISNRAPSAILDKISRATSIEDITKVGSGYLKSESDKLDEALKRAQINKINIETSQIGVEGQKPPTEAQITNAGYAQRIAQANKIIDANTGTLKNLGWTEFQLIQSNSPLANKLLSTEKQQAAQAIKSFITAKLRKESGASIAPSEFDDARSIYFPIPGDSLEVIAQKKQTRDEVLSNSIQASGDAYKANEADTYLDNVSSALNQGTSVGDYLQSLNLKK